MEMINSDNLVTGLKSVEYTKLSFPDKLTFLRSYYKVAIYNPDIQIELCSSTIFNEILSDVSNLHKLEAKGDEDEQLQLYTRLFFLLLHNSIVNNTHAQVFVFEKLFKDDASLSALKRLVSIYKTDVKVQKFLLSSLYNLYFLNKKISTSLSSRDLEILSIVFSAVDVGKKSNEAEAQDLKEVNDWTHILLNFILKDGDSIAIDTKQTLLELLIQEVHFLELIKDFIEFTKTMKSDSEKSKEGLILDITKTNIGILVKEFSSILDRLYELIKKLGEDRSLEKLVDVKLADYNNSTSVLFKRFLCFVDIISILLSNGNAEFSQAIYETLKPSDQVRLLNCSIEILKTTDSIYDDRFERFKLAKEKIRNEKLNESSVLHGFQTNLVKFLANFGLNNEIAKNYFIDRQKGFYYVLNHLRIDVCNPFKKEWSVLFVKTLTEKCQSLQKTIEELKPVDVDPFLREYILKHGKPPEQHQD